MGTAHVDTLRILFISINYAPEVTGIAPYTTGLAEHLASQGHDVRVITSMPHYPTWRVLPEHADLPKIENRSGVTLRRIRHHIPSKSGALGRIRMEVGFALRAVMTDWGRPDIVVCLSPSLVASAMALTRVKISRRSIKGIVWVQDLYSKGVVEAVGGGEGIARVAALGEAAALSLADRTVVIHERFKRTVTEALRVPEERVEVVRNWTHVGETITEPKDVDRMEFGWGARELVVLHAGNMGAKQGLDNVVEAGRLADALKLPLRFVLLGDGNQRSRLEALARGVGSVQFLDPLDGVEFGRALASADILLLNEKPGVSDMAVPSKLTTYFATGKPIIAATDPRSASAEEVVLSGGGVVVPAGDPKALLNEAIRLGEDSERASGLARKGREYQHQNLTADASLARFSSCIAHLSAADLRVDYAS